MGTASAADGAGGTLCISGGRSFDVSRKVSERGGTKRRARAPVRHHPGLDAEETARAAGCLRQSPRRDAQTHGRQAAASPRPLRRRRVYSIGSGSSGLRAHAADLNPVAVLLNKCNLELVPRWLDRPPVNPEVRRNALRKTGWTGAAGLAEDVRYYGNLIRERAIQKIGHLYPKVKLPKESGGREANVIAWLWARTVASPNPAAQGAHVPLVRSFWLSTKDKSGRAYVEPVINKDTLEYGFRVKIGKPSGNFNPAKGTVNRNGGTCLLTDAPIPFDHIRSEGKAGRIGFRLLAIVAELSRGRTYVSPVADHEGVAEIACVDGYPDSDVPEKALGFRVQLYGMNKHYKMFTPRQLTTMVTLSDLVKEVRRDVFRDACEAGLSDSEADHYALAVVTFLALALDRCADFNNGLCRWTAGNQKVMNLFGRQAIPMVWDFAEANTLGDSVGAWATCSNYVADCIEVLGKSSRSGGNGLQVDAAGAWNETRGLLVSTDPPYYDNIGYAASQISSTFGSGELSETSTPIFLKLFSCPRPRN